jgi:hypothetical protein
MAALTSHQASLDQSLHHGAKPNLAQVMIQQALDIQAGERVRWQLLGRSELRLVRLEAPTPAKGLKK